MRRVLVFNDLNNNSSPGFALMDQAIFDGLEKSSYQIELYTENLETTLFSDEESQRKFRDWYIHKYQHRKPDVIIAVGRASIKFMADSHENSFPGIPIIFCGSTEGTLEQPILDSHFTGVWAVARPDKTVDLALQLKPSTQRVIVVGGVGGFDRDVEAAVKESLRKYESRLEVVSLTDLDMTTLLERLHHMPSDSIVFHTSIMEDAAGTHFIDASQSIPMVAAAANAPVFILDDVDLGNGAVGGDLLSWAATGRVAAEMAVRVLNGEKPQDIPIVKSPNVYMFDWRALKRWGLQEKDLPPGSTVLNRQPTVWESYKWYIVGGVSLILLEALLITALLWYRARRKKAEQTLRESEERFRLVANTAPVMIWMSGTDKLCNYFNQPWLEFTGRPLELELGNGWADGVYKEDLDTCFKTYSESFDRRETFRMEYRLRRSDGEYRWVSDMGVPRFDADGSFAGYIGSCIDVTEQKVAGKALATIGRRLIEAHEEERTWIGRELHDDINQRLALLAVELDNWNQQSPAKGEFHKYVQAAKQRITDLGKDVQALSHRLHSSKLDYLGLASAAGSFCRELAEQRKVEIDFHQSGVPRNLPKEISLSLFRVLQESLQNAVKHSGVRHFNVELRGTPSEIQLIVNDLGAGFDQQETLAHRGLGLISMRERLQMVSGEFTVKSEPGRGTTIWARVPLEGEAQRASMAG